MKSRLFFPFALSAALPCLVLAQPPVPVVPAVVPAQPAATPEAKLTPAEAIAKAEQALAEVRANLVKQRDVVKGAIDKAAKLGQIRVSTSTTHKGLLERFQPAEGTLGDLGRVMIPPQVEGADALNAAWTDLRQAAQEAGARGQDISDRLLNYAAEELQKAARSGETPEAVDDADKLIAAWIKQAEFNRTSTLGPSSGAYTKESLQRLATFERAVLTAYRDKDAAALGTAFSRASSLRNDGRTISGHRVDEFVEEMRARCTEPFTKGVADAQRALEQVVMQNQPMEKREDVFNVFQEKAQAFERLRELSNRYNGASNRSTVVNVYRSALAVQEYLKSESETDTAPTWITVPEEGLFPVSAEFRKFYTGITAQVGVRRRQISELAEKRRQDAARQAEVKAEAEARAAMEQARKAISDKLKAIKTVEDLLMVANDLPLRQSDRIEWSTLQTNLQGIAALWLEGTPRLASGDSYPMQVSHPFLMEVRALRDRALRESTAKRLNLPQLKQAPLDGVPVMEALEQLARTAAEKAEWKQSYAILQNLPTTAANADRLQAIRSFLVAQNFEAGGQYREAADSYLAVLRTVGDFTPVKDAGERLKKLQSEHAELFVEKTATLPAAAVNPVAPAVQNAPSAPAKPAVADAPEKEDAN